MPADPATAQQAAGAALGPETLVGGRFLIERSVREDELTATWLARDQKTKRAISIRVLADVFGADKASFTPVRDEIKAAAKIKHRSLVATYGVGTHGTSTHFVASEWVKGTNLRDFVAKREGKPLSARGVFNVVAHVCKALDKAHELGCHGAVRPSVVWVTKSGRVKLADMGIARALTQGGRWQRLPETEQAYLAPEVKSGGEATAASDIFGIGALLYVLLTGRSPTDDFIAPSQSHPEATPEVDAILMKCLAADPQQRFTTPHEVSDALMPLVAGAPTAAADEFDVDVEVDVDVAASVAPPAPDNAPPPVAIPKAAPPPSVALPQPPPPPGLPTPPQRATPDPLATAAPTPDADSGPAAAPHRADVDFGDIMASLTKNDAPRWMAVKDGMDHGPFTAKELVKLIVDGEVMAEHGVLNMDTNERKPLAEYPEFSEFVAQYKLRKAESDHQNALEHSNKVEKRSNVAKFAILSAGVAAIALGGAGYLMNRNAAEKRKSAEEVDLAAMYESGQVKIKGTAGILKYKRRKGGGSSGGGASSSTGFTSYEGAMNVAMELGDATKGGGERQLTSREVAGVMDRRLNSIYACVGPELRRGGGLRSVTIDMAIQGNGKVLGASIKGGSGAFKKCVVGKVKRIKFPSFPAGRMGARYSFGVD